MNFNKLFLVVVLAITLFFGQSEAAPRWKGWKKIEKVGRNIANAAPKALPVIQVVKAVG